MRKVPFLILLFASSMMGANSQEMSVPVHLQYKLLMKVLAYDRNLRLDERKLLTIGVAFQSRYRTSQMTKEEFVGAVESDVAAGEGAKIKVIVLDISDEQDLHAFIRKKEIDVLYIAPLRALNIERLSSVAQAEHLLTLTGVSEFVEKGIVVGIGTKGDRPQIEINLAAAKGSGADFNSQLLRVAKIVD